MSQMGKFLQQPHWCSFTLPSLSRYLTVTLSICLLLSLGSISIHCQYRPEDKGGGYSLLVTFSSLARITSTLHVATVAAVKSTVHGQFFITSTKEVGYVFAGVCLFVCVLARWLKKLWQDLSEILWESQEWQKLPVIQFWGWSGSNPGFWITLKFSLPLLSVGHKGNRCQTEDGAVTWRTTWRWIKVF